VSQQVVEIFKLNLLMSDFCSNPPDNRSCGSELLPQSLHSLGTILECNLCLSLLCEPISISCGHTFCRVCLVKSLRQHKKQCPSCRAVCHVAAENAAENIIIKSMAMAIDSHLYSSRLEEFAEEKASWTTLYPIFYYNSALFPGSRLALHLFEPRYKLMMKRVVDTTRSFAYVPNFTNYSAQVGDIALIADLRNVEFLADGRCLLDAVILKRMKIVEHYVEDGTQGLHYCRVKEYNDDAVVGDALSMAQDLQTTAVTLLTAYLEMDPNRRRAIEEEHGPMPRNHPENLSLWLTAISAIPDRDRFALLSSKDTIDRLRRCISSLESMIQRSRQNALGAFNSLFSQSGSLDSLPATGVSSVQSLMEQITSVLLGRRQRSGSFEEDDDEVPGLMSDADSSDEEEDDMVEGVVPSGSEETAPHLTSDDSSLP